MNAISYITARGNLAKTMDRVCEVQSPVIVTWQNAHSMVMISLEDYEAMEETAYLLRSPANAARLVRSMAQAAAGKATKRKFHV